MVSFFHWNGRFELVNGDEVICSVLSLILRLMLQHPLCSVECVTFVCVILRINLFRMSAGPLSVSLSLSFAGEGGDDRDDSLLDLSTIVARRQRTGSDAGAGAASGGGASVANAIFGPGPDSPAGPVGMAGPNIGGVDGLSYSQEVRAICFSFWKHCLQKMPIFTESNSLLHLVVRVIHFSASSHFALLHARPGPAHVHWRAVVAIARSAWRCRASARSRQPGSARLGRLYEGCT
jgi:hypothetical protein